MKRIIVIGSGIVGSSIALHLAKAGAQVTVLDAELSPGGIATLGSWAWINASWGNDRDYVALRLRAMRQWRELDKTVPGLTVNWCGSLLWDLPEDKLRAFANEHKSWGYPTCLVGKVEIAAIEPALRDPPDLAVHVASEGSVDPSHAVTRLLEAARQAGANMIAGAHVKFLNESEGRVTGVTTHEETLSADEVVVAAGLGSPALLASIGMNLKMEEPEGLLIHTEPAPELLNGIVLSPKLHVRQTAEGRLIAGSDFGGADPGDDPHAVATAMLNDLQSLLKIDGNLQLEKFTVTRRPTPPDGIPALGRPKSMPGLFLAVTHSGITLAPIVGEIVTQELMHDKRDAALTRYHPDRHIT